MKYASEQLVEVINNIFGLPEPGSLVVVENVENCSCICRHRDDNPDLPCQWIWVQGYKHPLNKDGSFCCHRFKPVDVNELRDN